ncbi:hypothetical protein YTPLAS18_33180 [Nitrospira sp.]|nr:hypothetical protein YTPLAS18_33180 [Nitrospira sp.]
MTEQPEGDALTETIRVDTGPLQGHIAEVVRRASKRRSTGCWKPKRRRFVARAGTSVPRSGPTPGPAIISGSWRRRLAP